MGTAAAQVALHLPHNLTSRRPRGVQQQTIRIHDDPRSAVPALDRAGEHKGLLNKVRIIGGPKTFNGDYLGFMEFENFG